MNIRTFKSNKQALIDEGKRLVSLTDDAKFLRKVTLVNLMLNGATASSLSHSCGETARTLSNWIAIVDEQGFEALRSKKKSGRPFRLTPSQKEIIKDALLLPPEESGYTVWDGPSLSDYISKRFHMTLGVRQCQRLFHELGFSLIRPYAVFSFQGSLRRSAQGRVKKLKILAEDPDALVVFQDEVHFTVEATITRQWFPKGSCPKVRSYPGRQSVAYSGFVIPETGKLCTVKPDWFNFKTTIDSIRKFIQSMAQQTQKKLYLIIDNAPWHKKAKRLIETEEEYADIQNAVTIVSLPSYSPYSNPIEQVWRVTRREKTHNCYWSGLPKLTAVLDEWFGSFAESNEKLASLCSFAW